MAAGKAPAQKSRQRSRILEILLAYAMIAFGVFLIWLCLFEPAFMPEIQPQTRAEDLTPEELDRKSVV